MISKDKDIDPSGRNNTKRCNCEFSNFVSMVSNNACPNCGGWIPYDGGGLD